MAGTIAPPKGLLSYASYIGGEDATGIGWVYTLSSKSLLEDVFTSMRVKRALDADSDPDSAATRHPYVVGRCAIVGREGIDAATEAAAGAVARWSVVPLADRMRLGRMFRDQVLLRHDELVDLLVAEAHPRKLARWELTSLLQVFSDASLDWYRQQMHSEFSSRGRRLIIRRQADGVVCVNPPLNAPAPCAALAILALMAGNAVVVRAPRSIALSTMYLMRELVVPLLEELGAPPGTLNVICGKPREVLDRWLEHPRVDDIFYFGGSQEGLRFERDCIARGKKPILELAGNDGVLVWRDADLDQAAEAITECFFGSGQICMVPNYVVVHPAVADSLMERVRAQAASIRPGLPDGEDVLLSPVRRSENFFALLDQATAAGAELVCGGHRIELDGRRSDTGVFLEPTLLRVSGLSKARSLDAVRHETFFPLLPVIVPDDDNDDALLGSMLEFINANEYGLRNSIWARSPQIIDSCVAAVRNGGMLKVNDSHIGFVPYLASHGGTGLTGGVFGEANYPMLRTSHLQGVCIGSGTSPRIAAFDY